MLCNLLLRLKVKCDGIGKGVIDSQVRRATIITSHTSTRGAGRGNCRVAAVAVAAKMVLPLTYCCTFMADFQPLNHANETPI